MTNDDDDDGDDEDEDQDGDDGDDGDDVDNEDGDDGDNALRGLSCIVTATKMEARQGKKGLESMRRMSGHSKCWNFDHFRECHPQYKESLEFHNPIINPKYQAYAFACP